STAQGPGDNLYADVLVDVQVRGLKDRLFTYRVPEALMGSAYVGAQVLVPFGARQLVAGYIVGLSDCHNLDVSPKDIQEVVEPEPLFDAAYIDFLGYVAKKYCASLQDVVAAAIPACLTTRLRRSVKLAEAFSYLKDLDPAARQTALDSALGA